MDRLTFSAVLLLLASVSAAAAPAADLFVSPAGNDAWSGTLAAPNAGKTDGPLASLDAARLKVRELRRNEPARKTPVTVLLRGGDFRPADTVRFGPEDSGTADSPTRYAAYPDETPVVTGGATITGWKVRPDGRWTVTLDEVKAGRWNFSQLFVNGQRRMRPRLPKEGYHHIAGRASPPDPKKADDRFRFANDEFRPDWKNLGDVEVITFHPWFTSMLRIADVDAKERVVRFTGRTRATAAYGQLSPGMRYLVENVAEALSEPGEWYLDRSTGVLTYIPLPGETPENATVVAPRLEQLVALEAPAGGPLVENLAFTGLTFAHTNWVTPAEGSSISQAAVAVNAAFAATNARGVEVADCTFTQLGTYGLEIGQGCSNVSVRDSRFLDLGAGGIKVGTTAFPNNDPELTRGVVVRNNLIAHLGRTHPAAVGVWIGHASDVTVEHNDIYDLYYTGISAGWTWGYRRSKNGNIRIRHNHIHHLGQGVLSDMGGIYTLGASPGSVLEFNRIHDVTRDKYGGWGIYYDEGSTGYVARNNLLYRLQDGGFHQHYGQENLFVNNVILDSGEVAWGPTRLDSPARPGEVSDRPAFTFARNIISGWGGASVVRPEALRNLMVEHPELMKVDHNLYWNNGEEPRFKDRSLVQWRELGHDLHSVVADPNVPDPDGPAFRVPDGSPAAKLGFKPFDISKAGRTTREKPDLDPARWPRRFPPASRGPTAIEDGFEGSAVGATAGFATTSEEPPAATARVTDRLAFEGKQSLRFGDAPALRAAYNPHLYWRPDFKEGTLTARFALRTDGAAITHEWRGAGHPYATGPSIHLTGDGRLRAGDTWLAEPGKGAWVVVEIRCPLGKQAGRYDVRVRLPDGTVKEARGLPCSKDFRELHWFGFASVGDRGEAYLDALELKPE